MKNEICLSIPGLLGLPRRLEGRVTLPEMPALKEIVNHSSRAPAAAGRYSLASELLETPEPPLAELAWLGLSGKTTELATELAAAGRIAFADPVHLQAGMDDLFVIGPYWLDVTPAELDSLAATLNEHFAGTLAFELAGNQLFLVAGVPARIDTDPLYEVHARSARNQLSASDGVSSLHALLNEIQMLLHDHPVNTAREKRGAMPLNGLWIWGGGQNENDSEGRNQGRSKRRQLQDVRFSGVFLGHSGIHAGLARLANAEMNAVPDALSESLVAGSEGPLMIELDAAASALDRDDIAGWESALREIDRDWLAPALTALRRGQLAAISIYPGDACCYRVSRSDLWKFWRRLSSRPAELQFGD